MKYQLHHLESAFRLSEKLPEMSGCIPNKQHASAILKKPQLLKGNISKVRIVRLWQIMQ